MGSLNINGMRDGRKNGVLSEIINLKELSVIFLQETHSTKSNETEWGLWWKGEYILSHGTNLSAGVAILFSPTVKTKFLSINEIIAGRLLVVNAEICNLNFLFVNIYAPNVGAERVDFFNKLDSIFIGQKDDVFIVVGGDWNCTLDFTLDRNSEEPHVLSAVHLTGILKKSNLIDVWREHNPSARYFTWLRVSDGIISAARLDRFYISHNLRNRVFNISIFPNSISDHKLIVVGFTLVRSTHRSCYWHFNIKLLENQNFCEVFKLFWETWKKEKVGFEGIIQWWEVGKVHIRGLCQNYTSHSSSCFKKTLESLEFEIGEIEKTMTSNDANSKELWNEKKTQLSSILNERVKGALIRSRFTSIKDMDAPTTYFFNLERKVSEQKQMYSLKDNYGRVTSNPLEMRRIAVDFYSSLYDAETSDENCRDNLLKDLPVLSDEQKQFLETDFTFEEVTTAIMNLSSGRAPGLDGLPSEFYKKFWSILGEDYFKVLKQCFNEGTLPTSCQRAVLSLLPKKGDLTLLKNWRPVAVLCTEYKIFSKVLANRLNEVLHTIIHKDQSYCIKKRLITDNLHLVRDLYDLAQSNDVNMGLLSLDQEKAFDRVDHVFLFDTLKTFGFGDNFISKIKLLYTKATCMIKMAGSLSVPIQIKRGIRQGCPLSGQLYSITIEPLLCRLRKELMGLKVDNISSHFKLSAYADDITVIIREQKDIISVQEALECYGKASSALVNWSKSDALWCGRISTGPALPGGLQWGRGGFKYLGVHIGNDEYKKKNWEGLVEKVCARLSRWKWLLSNLSYRGRVLICNNLVASSLWHRMTILEPPDELVKRLQQQIVEFFWSGRHWLKAALLYLPVHEGGQGLIDIKSRVKAFRIQTVQRLLYGEEVSWAGLACTLLRKAGDMDLDRHLFLMDIKKLDLTGLSSFYRSLLNSWTLFKVSRSADFAQRLWLKEEPILFNSELDLEILKTDTLRKAMWKANITKIGYLLENKTWISAENLAKKLGMKSVRVAQSILNKILDALPLDFKRTLESSDEDASLFPELILLPEIGTWQENEGNLLTFKTPRLDLFSNAGKKAIYVLCVKVWHHQTLETAKESKWQEFFGPGTSPKGSWRSLYKLPIEKRSGDLQWRVVHGIIATNRYRAHIDPQVGVGCPFCGEEETVFHLFLQCHRLQVMFSNLEEWCQSFGEVFTPVLFIYGPKYCRSKREVYVLINFILGQAKMAVWLSRKNQMNGAGSTDVVSILRGLLKSRIQVEFTYYKLINNLEMFKYKWAVNQCICDVSIDGSLQLYV